MLPRSDLDTVYLRVVLLSYVADLVSAGANDLHLYYGTDTATLMEDAWFFEIIYPEELAFTYKIRPAKDFGLPFNVTWSGVSMVLSDPPSLCSYPKNAEDIEGAVVLAERGECSFLTKSLKAQEVGALAAVVTDNDSENDDYYIDMVDDSTQREVNIPAAFLLGKNGFVIKSTLRRLNTQKAIVNIPVNITNIPIHLLNQPPWLVW